MQRRRPDDGIVLTRRQAREVDRLAGEELGSCIVCAGPGNNGGDGLALARQLRVRFSEDLALSAVLAKDAGSYSGDAGTNLAIARAMGVETLPASRAGSLYAGEGVLVVDALLGTGSTRAPEGAVAELVGWANNARGRGARVLSIDVPTGLDCDTGTALGDEALVVRADHTCTLCALKPGFREERARAYTGDVSVGSIGVPRRLLERARELEG